MKCACLSGKIATSNPHGAQSNYIYQLQINSDKAQASLGLYPGPQCTCERGSSSRKFICYLIVTAIQGPIEKLVPSRIFECIHFYRETTRERLASIENITPTLYHQMKCCDILCCFLHISHICVIHSLPKHLMGRL